MGVMGLMNLITPVGHMARTAGICHWTGLVFLGLKLRPN